MDTLKKTGLIAILFFFLVLSASAQNDKVLQDAFSASYGFEYSGDYTKAIDALKKVYTEKSYEVNLRLGWLTYMSGLFTESAGYYQKAIALMPLSVEARLGYVNPAASLGNWEQVLSQYKEILKIDPKNSTVNYRLGLIYYGREDYNSAYKCFEQVVNLYPFDYNSTLYYAWTNYKLGKTREAKVLFNKVLLMQPADASALEGLGLIK
ncbi:MAG: Tetratricopeptide repeat protein [Bacteroidetes bacterium ADurb.Bin408]|nr:MAG: Tetratricopeptide repeat protein [Bacteroidetes bacterium ADurb.Bin408]